MRKSSTNMNELSELLNEYLRTKNISQSELARRARVSKGVISRYINNQAKQPDEKILIKIAKALGIPPKEILEISGIIEKEKDSNPTLEEINYLVSTLHPDQQEQVKKFIRFLAETNQGEKYHAEPNTTK